MSKISWNDLEDSDSSLSADDNTAETNSSVQMTLVKSVSDNFARKEMSVEQDNLNKLFNLKADEVWLYVKNYYPNCTNQIDEILSKISELKKKLKINNNVGWNILLPKDAAKKLITAGYTHHHFHLKFYYSTKNQEFTQLKQLSNLKKISYVEKNKSQSSSIKIQKLDSPKKLEETLFQKKQQKLTEKFIEKKKVKYVQKIIKNEEKIQNTYQLNQELKTNEDFNQIQKQSCNDNKKQVLNKFETQSSLSSLIDEKSDKLSKQLKKDNMSEEQEEETFEQVSKKLKEINKKTKTKCNKKAQKIDLNNPFSGLM